MEIQPVVVGTAGHIDHGKSTLVRALTGIDPDRLKEEVERGMTIDLGFARFQLPDGRTVGIVDVPGHERFIRNMVAGATGIDIVLLVVAADDGVMPQTREHLAIMTLLGVQRGLVALTKIDAVEKGMVELATEDIRVTVRGTFLEDAPILPVSSITRQGLPELLAALQRLAAQTVPRSSDGLFRMPIQRVFSSHGFGTVVTGIPVSGSIGVGDAIEILPGDLRGKVRGVQAYHEATERARAGHSTALNVADVDHHAVHRGCVAATPGFFKPARMLGARFEALATLDRPIENRTQIRLHTGTVEVVGEIVLLDCERLEPGGNALAQLRLDEPVVTAPGDRFVVRLESPAWTLGGGVILEESKHRLKRFKSFVVEELSRQATSLGSPGELLESVLRRASDRLHKAAELAIEIKRSREETEALLGGLAEKGVAVRLGPGGWIHGEKLASALARLDRGIAAWFEGHGHRQVIDVRDLRRSTGLDPDFQDALLEEAQRRGTLTVEAGGHVRPAGRDEQVDPATAALLERVKSAFAAAKFQPPEPLALAAAIGAKPGQVEAVIEILVDRGQLRLVSRGFFLTAELHDAARDAIVANCAKNGSLDIPSLRDQLGTTRKYLIPLLEHFDTLGLTLRQGGNRVLKRR
ncbi:MAG: selenocysteine-specific translation elongation factor [Planctomycetota bacterium]